MVDDCDLAHAWRRNLRRRVAHVALTVLAILHFRSRRWLAVAAVVSVVLSLPLLQLVQVDQGESK